MYFRNKYYFCLNSKTLNNYIDMLNTKDLEQIRNKGISESQIAEQMGCFEIGRAHV